MATTNPTWRESLANGLVLPALPLMLHTDGRWSQQHQRALLRYYIDAGAGGVAVGVHSTQFEIRDPAHGLFEPLLNQSIDVARRYAATDFVLIAGICGRSAQARREAELARDLGYHAGLLSVAALGQVSEEETLAHISEIARVLPIVGFYLQPAVGGRVFSYRFWRQFGELENVVAIKIAPFDRYLTWDVVRAVIESGRDDIALYTGNDDNIICDLLTEYQWNGKTRRIVGGLLGQWGVWTRRAVQLLDEIKVARRSDQFASSWLTRNMALTDANAVIFDAAHGFQGCIPGILEVLRRQGLAPSARCLDPSLTLSPGQAAELDRIHAAYPELTDDEFIKPRLSDWLA